MQISGSSTSALMLSQSASSILSDGVSNGDASALFGTASNSSGAGAYTGSDLFGLSSSSTAVSLTADTFASVMSGAGDSMVELTIRQATARVQSEAYAKMQSAQGAASVAQGISI